MVSVKLLLVITISCYLIGFINGAAVGDTILDKVNIDTYLKNERAVKQQIKCILKNGPCDSVGKEIKRLMPSVVQDSNVCPECTPSQLKKIKKIVNHLKSNYPAEWDEGVKKYGADGVSI